MILQLLRRRIELLERRVGGNPVTLHMPDGSKRQIPSAAKHYFKLAALLASEVESPLHTELQAIRDAVHIEEEAHIYELLQALLRGPVEEESESCIPMR